MYNDEDSLYHYTYRRDGSEPGSRYETRPAEPFRNYEPTAPAVEMKPAKKKGAGARMVALALACALLGGAAGGGAVWAATSRSGKTVVKETTIQVSGRTDSGTETGSGVEQVAAVNGKAIMTEAEIYAANVNSVVSINVTGNSTNVFGQVVPTASSGSGFFLTKDGYIITNYHVIEDSTAVKVTLYDGTSYDAAVIGGDKEYDIAVLKVDGTDFKPVTLGSSNLLNPGEHLCTIGNPLGDLTFSISEGVASSVNRALNLNGTPFNMIQTTCAINPGSSGGPLFNQYGEVVGVVSSKYTRYASTTVEGLSFAIPIDDVLSMVEDIMTNGYVANKPFLGITPQSMTETMAAQFKYSVTSGAFVCSVVDGSAAAKAGLKMGDVITKIDDTEIKTVEDLNAAKKKYSAGDKSTLTIYREGKTQTVDITWGTVPEDQTTNNSQQQQQQQTPNNGQNGGQYTIPYGNLFDYFFGNGFGGYGG